MTRDALGVAVWGLGGHALKNVLPAVQASSGVVLRGVCSRNGELVARTARERRCAGWTSPGEMLQDAGVDVVYLSTPSGLHPEHGRMVLEADKHLWCEKPLASTFEQAEDVTRMSRQRGLAVGEAFMYLYHSQFSGLQQILRSGRLGDLCAVTCRFGIPPLERPGFRLTAALGGGALLDVGSYAISVVVAMFPDVEPDILLADITAASGSPVDSAGRAVLAYPQGVRATLEWGTGCAYRNEIDIWGTQGSVLTDRIFSKPADYTPRFRFLDRHGREQHEDGLPQNHFVAMIETFRTHVDEPAAAERERVAIERRARLLDRIRRAATQEN